MSRYAAAIMALLLGISTSATLLANDTARLNRFLKSGNGMTPLLMGNAYTAIGEGPHALHYNAAALSRTGVAYHYENMDIKAVQWSKSRRQGLTLAPLGYAHWQNFSEDGTQIEVSQIGFGRKGVKGLDWGSTYKNISYQSSESMYLGNSIDLDFLAYLTPEINLGLAMDDIISNGIPLQTTYRLGAAYQHQTSWILTTDLTYHKEGETPFYTGSIGTSVQIDEDLKIMLGLDRQWWSGGLRYDLSPFAIELGVRQSQETGRQMMAGIRWDLQKEEPAFRRPYTLWSSEAYAKIPLGMNITEGKSSNSLFGGSKLGTNDLLTLIHHANEDEKCQGYVIRIGNFSGGLSNIATIQEIRKELQKGKDKGKYIMAYLEGWATFPEYYLASIADQIIMPELGMLSHLGLEIEVKKKTSLLSSLGEETLIISSGTFKDDFLPDADQLSPLTRTMITSLLYQINDQVLDDIKQDRKIETLPKALFNGQIISAKEAKEAGLVDGYAYFHEIQEILKEKRALKRKPNIVDFMAFTRLPSEPLIFSPFNKIAVIEVDGDITMGKSETNFLFGQTTTGADDMDRLIDRLVSSVTTQGVILRINSGGGSLMASDRIYKGIERLKKSGKLVYASLGHMATSGGYYVALNADKIYANKSTLTGSIGVISIFKNKQAQNEFLGLEHESIKTGEFMDSLSPNRAMNDKEKAMIQAFQEDQYTVFIDKLKENRHLTDAEAQDVGQGQLISGSEAKDINLVDEVGNFYDAIDDMGQALKLDEPEVVFLRTSQPGFNVNWINLLFQFL